MDTIIEDTGLVLENDKLLLREKVRGVLRTQNDPYAPTIRIKCEIAEDGGYKEIYEDPECPVDPSSLDVIVKRQEGEPETKVVPKQRGGLADCISVGSQE